MTVELLEESAADVEELLIVWLTPLGPTAFRKTATDDLSDLPFRVVRRVAGLEDDCDSLDSPIVSVHTFCDASDPDAAADECKRTHKRMMLMARELPEITLADGRQACVESVECVEKPTWVDYTDEILRKVGRYQLGLTIVAE